MSEEQINDIESDESEKGTPVNWDFDLEEGEEDDLRNKILDTSDPRKEESTDSDIKTEPEIITEKPTEEITKKPILKVAKKKTEKITKKKATEKPKKVSKKVKKKKKPVDAKVTKIKQKSVHPPKSKTEPPKPSKPAKTSLDEIDFSELEIESTALASASKRKRVLRKWHEPRPNVPRGILVAVHGLEGVGKSDFGLTANSSVPENLTCLSSPFIVIDTQDGVKRAEWRYPELYDRSFDVGDIYRFDVEPLKKDKKGNLAATEAHRFIGDMDEAISDAYYLMQEKGGGTLVIDSWSDYDITLTEATFAEYEVDINDAFGGINRQKWSRRNRKIKSMLTMLKQVGNVLLLGEDKPVYGSGGVVIEDEFEAAWHKKVKFLADIVARLEYDPEEEDARKRRKLTVEKAGFGTEEDSKTGAKRVKRGTYKISFVNLILLFKERLQLLQGLRKRVKKEKTK